VLDDTLTATVPRPVPADPAGRVTAEEAMDPAGSEVVADAVEELLERFVHAEVTALATLDPALAPLARTASDAVLGGGKRLRPQFAWWGWRANHGRGQLSAVLPALASLELLHAFALVHDDVMDRSETRRGRPSAHRSLANHHARAGLGGDARRFGDSAAILVGDLCLVWADRLMATAQIDRDRIAAARHVYDAMRIEAIAGQFLDILGECTPRWTVDEALRTARLKTAAYTVARPLQFGAALAGPVASAVSAALTGYGVAVGEAFQLCDDLLGGFGDPAVTGKPAGDDLVQGKSTVLLQTARERAGDHQLVEIEYLIRVAGAGDGASDATAQRLADLVVATGAPELVRTMIDQRLDEARRAIAGGPIDREPREALIRLAATVARRRS
jgi:geranylgeranyl diphosphate synthase type I